MTKGGRARAQHDYCFLAPVWKELFPEGSMFELSTVFRQAETQLVDLLSDVRYGALSRSSIDLLHSMNRELQPPPGIEPTLLFSTNSRVDEINCRKLGGIQSKEWTFTATDEGKDPFLSQIRKNCIADYVLRLKAGAQVMLIKNIDQKAGLVNGAQGRVGRGRWSTRDVGYGAPLWMSNLDLLLFAGGTLYE